MPLTSQFQNDIPNLEPLARVGNYKHKNYFELQTFHVPDFDFQKYTTCLPNEKAVDTSVGLTKGPTLLPGLAFPTHLESDEFDKLSDKDFIQSASDAMELYSNLYKQEVKVIKKDFLEPLDFDDIDFNLEAGFLTSNR